MLTLHGVSYLVCDAEDAGRDLEVIARELHCDTVMLIGDDVPRLIAAAQTALSLGLAVHLRPDATDQSQSRMLELLDAVAAAAEALRLEHPDQVTLLVGSELSHSVPGIVPGPRSFRRLRLIIRHHRLLRRRIDKRLDRLLARAAAVARRHFNGPTV